MQIIPTYAAVLDFLIDESIFINPKIKRNSETDYSIAINEIFISDSKRRLAISTVKNPEGKTLVVFNGFKSSALMGDDYHGSFYKFVKLIKGFHSTRAAKFYFFHNYLVKYISLNDISYEDDTPDEQVEIKPVSFPNNYEKLSFKKLEHQPYVNYLIERNVNIKNISHIKLYVDKITKRLVFPVYNEDSELIFYTGRSIVPHILRWLKADVENVYPLWNFENVNGEIIFIFEGIFDAIHFRNGIALLGAYWNDTIRDAIISKKFNKIVVFLDNDDAGYLMKTKIAESLVGEGLDSVYIYNYKGIKEKDFSDMRQNGIDIETSRILKYNYETKLKMRMGLVK